MISFITASFQWLPTPLYIIVSAIFTFFCIFVSQCDNTIDTDQFLVESFFDVKVVQNLDYDGMPY